MKEEMIRNIFKGLNIEISKIESANNSFSSNVYIVETRDDKYVFKINGKEQKRIRESKYIEYLSKYITTPKLIDNGIVDDKNYIIMTFVEGENKFDEDVNSLTDEQIENIGILLGKLHSLPLIDEDNDFWITYLNNTLEKTQDVLKGIFKEDNEVIYNYLKKYINNKIKNNYKNSIVHMDFRIGNLIFNNNEVGLIDMEGMKNGEYVFDFVKMKRLLSSDQFNKLLTGYKKIKNVDNDFYDKLDFYSLFDSYTTLWWIVNKSRVDSDFYRINYSIVLDYLSKLKK